MPFEKGHKKAKGRPSGSANKETKQLREFIASVLEDNYDKFMTELEKLEGRDYINAWQNMLEYCTPKLQRVDMEVKETIDYDELPLEARKMLNELNDKYRLN